MLCKLFLDNLLFHLSPIVLFIYFLLSYHWHINMMIQYLYTLQNDYHNKSSIHYEMITSINPVPIYHHT